MKAHIAVEKTVFARGQVANPNGGLNLKNRMNKVAPLAKHYTREQILHHVEMIESMLILGHTVPQVIKAVKAKFGCGPNHITRKVNDIRDRWLEEEKERRPLYKAEQIRRVRSHLHRAMRDGSHRDVQGYEKLLAQLTGTLAPIEVNVGTIAGRFVDALDLLTDEQIQQMEDKYVRDLHLAEKAREMIPVLEAKFEEVK